MYVIPSGGQQKLYTGDDGVLGRGQENLGVK